MQRTAQRRDSTTRVPVCVEEPSTTTGAARRDGDHAVRRPRRSSWSPSAVERACLRWLLRRAGDPPVRMVLLGGVEWPVGGEQPALTLRIHARVALLRMLLDPSVGFGEGYSSGEFEIEGDLVEFLIALAHASRRAPKPGWLQRVWSLVDHRPGRNSLSASRQNIHHHYDIRGDFYKLWLDEQLVYTCAYFPCETASLEEAQTAKLDHVCRKLRLRPGETVVEAGCGWGALALHMARHYGVSVRAYNISHEQIAYARRQAAEWELERQVEFIEDDWRRIRGEFDVFVSVGMLEHVGRRHYRRLGDVIDRCLRPEGRGLVHSIGRNRPEPLDRWIERRIFPGAYPPTLGEAMAVFEPHAFSILDVENLRLHYALTLRHWLARYERSAQTVERMFGPRFLRMWRLYLASSVAAFETGWLQLFQIVFARGTSNHIPWTRAHLYTNASSVGRCNAATQ